MEKLVKLSNSHEGRDKFLKFYQYLFQVITATTNSKETIEYLKPSLSKN